MAHVSYEDWAHYLLGTFQEYRGGSPESVLDIGCGTGRLLYYFQGKIPERHGLDNSSAMLRLAAVRDPDARWTNSDFQKPLPWLDECFDWIVCTHDSLNYILEPAGLAGHFQEVYRILKPGGLCSVDFVSEENILENHAGRSITLSYNDCGVVWSNSYDKKILTSNFLFTDSGGNKHMEIHRQRFYSVPEILSLADGAGFSVYREEGDYEPRKRKSGDSLWNFHFKK